MKKAGIVLVVFAAFIFMAGTAFGLEESFKRGTAQLHQIMSPFPDSVSVDTPYNKSISLHKLNKNEVAYWIPEGGKFISAGKYSYLWCRVINDKTGKSTYHWIAVTSNAMNEALDLAHQYSDGVALFSLSKDGNMIAFKAYPYSTIHAIAEGKKVIDVKK